MDPSSLPLLTALFFVVEHIIPTESKLTAVNDSYHAGYLYMHFRSIQNTNILLRNDWRRETSADVCDYIMGSGYFDNQGVDPIDMNFDESTPQSYVQALQRARQTIEVPQTPHDQMRIRPYILGRLRFEGFEGHWYVSGAPIFEHVLICLGKKRYSEESVAYYISKEYNLAEDVGRLGLALGLHVFRKPARFIFKPVSEGLPLVALAEQAALQHTNADFNVELQYIRTREQNLPETNRTHDPVCNLTSRHTALSQHERLCVAILSSSYFEGRERYAQKPHLGEECTRLRVEFQSESAIRMASGVYEEWMLPCRATVTQNVYYVSRSYVSNHVFVYTRGSDTSNVYLENYSFNIRLLDQRITLTRVIRV